MSRCFFTTPFTEHVFWTSVPCIKTIDPELRDASVVVLCFLTGPSELMVYLLMPACSSIAA